MCHRTNWKEAYTLETNYFNFKWLQISYNIDYSNLGIYGLFNQMVNHYENHFAISNKANMFMNLMYYCEQRKISVFKYVPFTIIFEFKLENGKLKNDEIQKIYEEKLQKLEKFIGTINKYVVNYDEIGKYYNEEKYKSKAKTKEEEKKEDYPKNDNSEYIVYRDYFQKLKLIEKVPTTFVGNRDSYHKNKEINNNLEKTIGSNTVIQIPTTHYTSNNMWVIKPLNLCRGMCIQIVNNFKQMKNALNLYKEGVDYHFSEKVIDENDIIEEEKNTEKKSKNSKLYYCNQIIM